MSFKKEVTHLIDLQTTYFSSNTFSLFTKPFKSVEETVAAVMEPAMATFVLSAATTFFPIFISTAAVLAIGSLAVAACASLLADDATLDASLGFANWTVNAFLIYCIATVSSLFVAVFGAFSLITRTSATIGDEIGKLLSLPEDTEEETLAENEDCYLYSSV